jgi:hypothetical protein
VGKEYEIIRKSRRVRFVGLLGCVGGYLRIVETAFGDTGAVVPAGTRSKFDRDREVGRRRLDMKLGLLQSCLFIRNELNNRPVLVHFHTDAFGLQESTIDCHSYPSHSADEYSVHTSTMLNKQTKLEIRFHPTTFM